MTEATAKKNPGWLPLALDYGPLVAFFAAYKISGNIILGTGVFMATIIIAVIISKWKLGRVSPMMWLSAILVVGFGGLTIYMGDPKFIQIKPTIIYILLAALLFGGLFRGKALLKYVLEHGYSGLSDAGWLMLSRNWAWFFLAMAVLNEALRMSLSFDAWLTAKVWGITILSMVFAAANIPMLMKHGLGGDEVKAP
jgi:intracellular septation protein